MMSTTKLLDEISGLLLVSLSYPDLEKMTLPSSVTHRVKNHVLLEVAGKVTGEFFLKRMRRRSVICDILERLTR